MRTDKCNQLSNRTCSTDATRARTARVRSSGAAIWLNADELAELGINPDEIDTIEIRIRDGLLRLAPAKNREQ